MFRLLTEAAVIGIVLVLIGLIVTALLPKSFKVDLPTECKEWNKKHAMEISLFFTGVLAHLLFEGAGINAWYCKNGNACSPFL